MCFGEISRSPETAREKHHIGAWTPTDAGGPRSGVTVPTGILLFTYSVLKVCPSPFGSRPRPFTALPSNCQGSAGCSFGKQKDLRVLKRNLR